MLNIPLVKTFSWWGNITNESVTNWECKLMQPPWKTVWRFFKKLKRELPYDPAIPLLGTYLEKTIIQKDTCILTFIAALFITPTAWSQPKCPSADERIKRMQDIQWNTPQP